MKLLPTSCIWSACATLVILVVAILELVFPEYRMGWNYIQGIAVGVVFRDFFVSRSILKNHIRLKKLGNQDV